MNMNKYEVVISGVSGAFPECSNFSELEEKLYTDENLVTADGARWKSNTLRIK